MNFLIDTDVFSGYFKGDGRVFNRFIPHGSALATSALTAGELYSSACRARAPVERLRALRQALEEIRVLPVDLDVARKCGELRAALLDQARPTPTVDLFIASTALCHDLTLVTHNVRDFAHVPGLRIEDWLE